MWIIQTAFIAIDYIYSFFLISPRGCGLFIEEPCDICLKLWEFLWFLIVFYNVKDISLVLLLISKIIITSYVGEKENEFLLIITMQISFLLHFSWMMLNQEESIVGNMNGQLWNLLVEKRSKEYSSYHFVSAPKVLKWSLCCHKVCILVNISTLCF